MHLISPISVRNSSRTLIFRGWKESEIDSHTEKFKISISIWICCKSDTHSIMVQEVWADLRGERTGVFWARAQICLHTQVKQLDAHQHKHAHENLCFIHTTRLIFFKQHWPVGWDPVIDWTRISWTPSCVPDDFSAALCPETAHPSYNKQWERVQD